MQTIEATGSNTHTGQPSLKISVHMLEIRLAGAATLGRGTLPPLFLQICGGSGQHCLSLMLLSCGSCVDHPEPGLAYPRHCRHGSKRWIHVLGHANVDEAVVVCQHLRVTNHTVLPVGINVSAKIHFALLDLELEFCDNVWVQVRSAAVLLVKGPVGKGSDIGLVVLDAGSFHRIESVCDEGYCVIGDPFSEDLLISGKFMVL
jgi:hypothetical protein